MAKEKSIILKKYFLVSGGFLCVTLGTIGIVLPGIPTTPFLLLAAACFARSSPRFHKKLLDNKVFGRVIRDWEENRTVPRKAKIIGLLTLFLGGCYSFAAIDHLPLKISVLLLLLIPTIILLRLPESKGL
ncbi:MAG: YbaN family protein [Proteobacteria bacterium]|nr:YbaN family protein [Pseudomonadota bacterium]MBU1139050.1 YbaN family protein [Pseudomonadota bacterium]MBU1231733.1 YbaN family protein [Pseudomonadota bacterium]MBU1419598.1 YbaN family protein [Pseudomonadota bacterium]MBU1455852.1 YbaN family protein [Pseudomonadota bacterium]